MCHTTWLKNVFVRITSSPWSSMMWLIDRVFSLGSPLCSRVSLLHFALLFPRLPVLCPESLSMWTMPRQITTAPPPEESTHTALATMEPATVHVSLLTSGAISHRGTKSLAQAVLAQVSRSFQSVSFAFLANHASQRMVLSRLPQGGTK